MEYISETLATYSCVNLDDRVQFELDGVVEKEIKQLIVLKISNSVLHVWITHL